MTFGIALALAAAVGWGAGDVFARRAMFRASAGVVLTVSLVVLVTGVAVVTVASVGWRALAVDSWRFYALAALLAVFVFVLATMLYFQAMRRCGVTIASPILGAGPLATVLFAVLLRAERPNLPTIAAALLIVAGVLVILTDRHRVLR